MVIFTAALESHFLRVVGTVKITKSTEQINKYWLNSDERKFKDGRTDSRIRILKVSISSSMCLKFPSNNMIDILKFLGRAIGGRREHSEML
jgi:general stress protein 26